MAINAKKVQALIKSLEDLLESLKEPEEEEEEEEEEAPVKRTRTTKKTKKVVEEEEEETEEEEEEDDDGPTLNEIRALAVKASKKATDGKEKVLAALQRHGTERLTEIDEEHYPALKAMLDKIIKDDDFDPRTTGKKAAAKKTKKSEDF